jgi:hypothetical protein
MHESMCALLCIYFINKACIHLCFVDNLLGKEKILDLLFVLTIVIKLKQHNIN